MSDAHPQPNDEPPSDEQPHVEYASEEPPPAAPTPPPKARRGHAAAWLVLIILVILAGAGTSPWWAPPLAPLLPWAVAPGPADDTQRQQVAALEQRLAALEARPAVAPRTPAPGTGDANTAAALDKANAQLAALDRRLARAEQIMAQLQERPASGGDTAALAEAVQRAAAEAATLGERVAALEAKIAAQPEADTAALSELQGVVEKVAAAVEALRREAGHHDAEAQFLALGQLRAAMQGSAPFPAPLAEAAALAQDDPAVTAALTTLKGAAASGIPSLASLRDRFAAAAGEIASAGAAQGEDSWSDAALAKLRALVTVRRVGPEGAAAAGPAGAVAKAENALAGDDLAGAVAALATLRGNAALAAKPWLDTARQRLDAEATLDAAASRIATRLGQKQP